MMLAINMVVLIFVIFILTKKSRTEMAVIKQLGLLELTWICFLLMTGLYYAFGTLEIKDLNQSFAEAAGAATMKTFYILGIFLLAHLVIVGTIIRQVFTARNK